MSETSFPCAAVPTIETERLVLRGHTARDLDASFAIWGDPSVTRHIGGQPSTREQVWNRLLRYTGHWALMGYGYWAVVEKASGRLCGEVGLAHGERDLVLPVASAPEAGWVVAPWAQGQGYATESVGAALGWIARARGVKRTTCIIDPPNLISIRVAGKLGFIGQGQAMYEGTPTLVFERVAAA